MPGDAISTIRILFRCDGGRTPEIGTGHVARCSRLAEALASDGDVEASFLMGDNDFSRAFASGAKWKVHLFPENDLKACAAILSKHKPDILVVDRLDSDPAFMDAARKLCRVLVTVDDLGPGAKLADLVINGIVGDGKGSYTGPAYVITPPQPGLGSQPGASLKEIRPVCEKIFVSFGGYDHLNLTLKAARALESLDKSKDVRIAVGSEYPFQAELDAFMKSSGRRFSVYRAPENFAELLSGSDLAITNGGLTLFEAMAAGVPALVLAQYDHQAKTGSEYAKRGACGFLGLGDAVPGAEISRRAAALMSDHEARQRMSRKARKLVDGKGLRRVADLVRVVRPLNWDSGFFRMKIAKVTASRLNERMASFIDDWCAANSVRCLYYLCDCDHAESVSIAEAHGFHFTDIRLTLEADLEGHPQVHQGGHPESHLEGHQGGHQEGHSQQRGTGPDIRECATQDLPGIRAIAGRSYVMSRYYYDGHFSKEMLERFYSDWLEGTFRSPQGKVFVAHRDGKPVGYVSGEVDSAAGHGRIILVGVDEASSGDGTGRRLVDAMLGWMQGRGSYTVEVVTQGRNIPAQRLYQKCGFKIVSAHIWYHKWFQH